LQQVIEKFGGLGSTQGLAQMGAQQMETSAMLNSASI